MRPCSRIWKISWNRVRGDTRSLLCVGPARVPRSWPQNFAAGDIGSAPAQWPSCCMGWTTVYRPTARRERDHLTRTVTPSSSTSTAESRSFKSAVSPWYPWIRRRRNWSETLRMAARNGNPKAHRSQCGCMILSTRNSAKRFPTVSMMWPGIADGSASVPTTTRRSSLRKRFIAGGDTWGRRRIRKPKNCSSWRMGVAAIVAVRVLEDRLAATGRPDRNRCIGVSLSAGNQQVEQDRAPHVFSYHGELERQTAHQPRGDRQSHWQHDHEKRTNHSGRVGYQYLPDGNRGH